MFIADDDDDYNDQIALEEEKITAMKSLVETKTKMMTTMMMIFDKVISTAAWQ